MEVRVYQKSRWVKVTSVVSVVIGVLFLIGGIVGGVVCLNQGDPQLASAGLALIFFGVFGGLLIGVFGFVMLQGYASLIDDLHRVREIFEEKAVS